MPDANQDLRQPEPGDFPPTYATTTEEKDAITDTLRLDWLEKHAFTAYRSLQPDTGKPEGHAVLVDERKVPRVGIVHDTLRECIDEAMEGITPAPQQKPDCKAIAGVDPCSALAEALDDGQEVEMHHFWNPSKQRNDYRVRICGDCFIEAEHENLNDAINSAAEKYQLWEEDAE